MTVSVLRQILDALGPAPLHLLTAQDGADVPVSGALIHEPRAPLPPMRNAMLFAVGVRPTSLEAGELLGQAALAGYTCLVIKRYGESAGQLVATASETGISLLAADEDIAWHHLDALVSSVLAETGRTVLGAGAPAVGDLFALANAIAAMVGGATTIEDPRQRILAYSTLPDQPIDEDRRQGILGLQVPELPANGALYREVHGTTLVQRFTDPSGLPRLAVSVHAGSELLGSIWVVDAGALDHDAVQALSQAAATAALHLLAARTAADVARRQRADVLRRLLADPAAVNIVAPQLSLNPDVSVAVAAFVVVPRDGDGIATAQAATRLADLVSVCVEAHYGRHGCALIEGTVYALLPTGPAGQSYHDFMANIARRAMLALRIPIHAALGSHVAGLHLAARSRQDADVVLKVLAERPAEPDMPSVATIDEVRASATLLELTEDLAGNPRMTQGLGPAIRVYDREHATAYARTLLTYLDANSDIAAASRRLNVHPNTCRYRITRAEEIFRFSLADQDERLLLWIQLRVSDRFTTQ
ncbi:PucR family transcriptional regulator [Streptomyces atratus]|uniref:PucR family transcriptional regulator n=1 Tax=Streptomyces atratus TaxID=1893 RepID=UPI00225653EB|nr:helix-turn-helix domain-containing protein [Streptomyces atratus]MCX5345368.1 helix-turn-helix domain-containing protein [Streptomyces atratus]